MSSHAVLKSSSALLSRLSSLMISSSPRSTATRGVRCFSGKGTDNNGDDPFGVNYDDGNEQLGPTLPPKYIRDSATGKLTGKVEAELTEEERSLLKMDDLEREKALMERLVEQWSNSTDDTGDSKLQSEFASRIREEEMALNTLGRSAEAQSLKGINEEGGEEYTDESGFSNPLSPAEFRTFQKYMKNEHKVDVTEGDIPVISTGDDFPGANKASSADNPDLDLSWMSAAAQREINDSDNDPFLDLMPGDLSVSRLVNRRRAKSIPKKLLHHNNLSLLRRYVTPGGQIMNRVQSRLGAKDQRKIAKLVKRARHLGLIPHMGQWKYENHGNVHEKDIQQNRDWEEELARRGLVTPSGSKADVK